MSVLIFGGNAPPAPFVPRGASLPARGRADRGGVRRRCRARRGWPVRSARPCRRCSSSLPRSRTPNCRDSTRLITGASWRTRSPPYLDALSPEVISIMMAQLARRQSPMSVLLAVPLGGAFCQVPDEATAFGLSRAPCVVVDASAFAPDPGLLGSRPAPGARQLWADLLPYSQGPGGYVNLMADYQADLVLKARLWSRQVPAARADQGRLRPRQRLPPQCRHQPRRVRRSAGSPGAAARPVNQLSRRHPGSDSTAAYRQQQTLRNGRKVRDPKIDQLRAVSPISTLNNTDYGGYLCAYCGAHPPPSAALLHPASAGLTWPFARRWPGHVTMAVTKTG